MVLDITTLLVLFVLTLSLLLVVYVNVYNTQVSISYLLDVYDAYIVGIRVYIKYFGWFFGKRIFWGVFVVTPKNTIPFYRVVVAYYRYTTSICASKRTQASAIHWKIARVWSVLEVGIHQIHLFGVRVRWYRVHYYRYKIYTIMMVVMTHPMPLNRYLVHRSYIHTYTLYTFKCIRL